MFDKRSKLRHFDFSALNFAFNYVFLIALVFGLVFVLSLIAKFFLLVDSVSWLWVAVSGFLSGVGFYTGRHMMDLMDARDIEEADRIIRKRVFDINKPEQCEQQEMARRRISSKKE